MMKHIFLITFLFLFCTACNNDDDDDDDDDGGNNPSTDAITGTWRMISFNYEGEINTGDVTGTITGEGFDIDNVQVTFLPNGTMQTNGGTFKVLLTTTVNGESTTQELSDQTQLDGSSWRREGNMLYMENEDNPVGEIGYPIIEVSQTTLHIGGTMTLPGSPMPVTIDILFERVN